MGKANLPQPLEAKTKGFHWAKRAATAGMSAKKFSVIEGKRALKMLEEKGFTPLAFEVAPDGGFRFEVTALPSPATGAVVNPWDKVL